MIFMGRRDVIFMGDGDISWDMRGYNGLLCFIAR